MTRIVSIWLPHWPIERLRATTKGTSAEPPENEPFALTETNERGLIIKALNSPALALGIRAGIGLADARAAVPHLRAAQADPDGDALAFAVR